MTTRVRQSWITSLHYRRLLALSRPDSQNSSTNSQFHYMQNDFCICVDEFDRIKGHATKQECHEVRNGKVMLHRAFSLFIFRLIDPADNNGCQDVTFNRINESNLQLLMQQRASTKLTYPTLWSNTCCSHPLKNYPNELIETDAIGVRHAAQRKALHELGIAPDPYLPLSRIHYLSRILYHARNEPFSEQRWAEHEVDYLLVTVLDPNLGDNCKLIEPNPDEVSDYRWVTLDELGLVTSDSMFEGSQFPAHCHLTPWFRGLISTGLMRRIWKWATYSCDLNPSDRFLSEDASWDRSKILRLQIS